MRGSAHGQDRFVIEVLDGMQGGFFLDSGASDGVNGNNTLILESAFNWTGICIEPNPTFFESLVRERRCHSVNCCLYDHEGNVDFVEADVLGGILDEYHPSLLQLAKTTFGVPVNQAGRPMTVTRPARTVRSVLQECNAPKVIDYWSLDTEGSELAILKSFPFDEYSFRVLTVEHNWLPVREEIRQLLESHGYSRIRELGVDDGYVKGVKAPQAAWRSRAWRRLA